MNVKENECRRGRRQENWRLSEVGLKSQKLKSQKTEEGVEVGWGKTDKHVHFYSKVS